MEESPEQILARLARYSDSLKRARPSSPIGHFQPIAVTPFHRWYGRHHDEFIPGAPLHRPLREAGGMLSSVSACVFALFAFISFGTGPATAVVAAMIVIGLVATWWRIPLALSWTIGAVVGAALVLLS